MATESGERTDVRRLSERLEMLDQRLDNMDSVVTNLVERVMRQPIVLHIACPGCGKTIEITLTGNVRVGKGGT